MKTYLTLLVFMIVSNVRLVAQESDEDLGEVVELDTFEVTADASRRLPDLIFELESPRFAYYEVEPLPKGGLIMALDFIDRYRESQVPGPRKWAAMIYFPWIDGYGNPHDEWICLYAWDDIVYGFSPGAKFEDERRFAVTLPFEERRDPERLLALAEAFVERVAPAVEDWVYVPTLDAEGNLAEDELEFFEVPAGRVDAIRVSDKEKEPEELVAMAYEYLEDPNPLPINSGEMGPVPPDPNRKFKWGELFDFSAEPTPFELARVLLMPRWSQQAEIIYEKDILFFKDVRQKARVLLFNIGNQIYAYHPEYGVWRTEATLPMLQAGQGSNLITYPGGVEPLRVLIHPWKKKKE